MKQPMRRRVLRACGALPLAALLPTAHAQPDDLDVPPPAPLAQSAIDAFLAAARAAGGIVDGRSPHRLYVVFDPNCPYCHQLYDDLRPYVARGQVAVSWIVVGFLGPSSLPKAAAILQARDPLAALRSNEARYSFPRHGEGGGGVAPAATIAPATRARLARNLDMLRRIHVFGVPVMVWRGTDGEARLMLGEVKASQLSELVALVA